MKTLKLTVFAAVLSLLLPGQASAQRLFGAHSYSLDIALGGSSQMYTVSGDTGRSRDFASSIMDNFFRYTYFFSDRFGVFAQAGDNISYIDERSFLSTVNKADGGKYRYRLTDRYTEVSGHTDSYFIGASYNWMGRKVQCIARVGGGLVVPELDNCSYERQRKDGTVGPEFFTYDKVMVPSDDDFLLDAGTSYKAQTMFGVTASLQLVEHVRRGVYFFVEPAVTVPFGAMEVQRSYIGSKPANAASNWVESMAWGDSPTSWITDPSSEVSTVKSFTPAPIFRLDFGIGFNITSKKYRHE